MPVHLLLLLQLPFFSCSLSFSSFFLLFPLLFFHRLLLLLVLILILILLLFRPPCPLHPSSRICAFLVFFRLAYGLQDPPTPPFDYLPFFLPSFCFLRVPRAEVYSREFSGFSLSLAGCESSTRLARSSRDHGAYAYFTRLRIRGNMWWSCWIHDGPDFFPLHLIILTQSVSPNYLLSKRFTFTSSRMFESHHISAIPFDRLRRDIYFK